MRQSTQATFAEKIYQKLSHLCRPKLWLLFMPSEVLYKLVALLTCRRKGAIHQVPTQRQMFCETACQHARQMFCNAACQYARQIFCDAAYQHAGYEVSLLRLGCSRHSHDHRLGTLVGNRFEHHERITDYYCRQKKKNTLTWLDRTLCLHFSNFTLCMCVRMCLIVCVECVYSVCRACVQCVYSVCTMYMFILCVCLYINVYGCV